MPNGVPTVLVVDPDPTIVEIGAAAAHSSRLCCTGVSTAHAAIELLKDQVFSLVVLEQDLPDATGIDLLAEILRLYPHQPYIFYTAASVHFDDAQLDASTVALFPKTKGHHRFWSHLLIFAPLAYSMMKLGHKNALMTRKIERIAPLERMIGRYAERWRVSHDAARRIINDFARSRRLSLLEVAKIAEDRNDEVQQARQKIEAARIELEARLRESEPGLLLELEDFSSSRLTLSLCSPTPVLEAVPAAVSSSEKSG